MLYNKEIFKKGEYKLSESIIISLKDEQAASN